MAIEFIDGCDHLSSILNKWSGVNLWIYNTTAGRFGGGGIQNLGAGAYLNSRGLPNRALRTIHFAFKTTAATRQLFYLMDSNKNIAKLILLPTGQLRVNRIIDQWDNEGILGTTTDALVVGDMWNHIQFKYEVGASGSYEVKFNNRSVLSGSGIETRNPTANTYTNWFYFREGTVIDDIIVTEGEFLGDVKVDTFYPTSDGSSSQFTPSTGTDHFAVIDEAQANDTDYISSDTVDQKDLFQYDVNSAGIKGIGLTGFIKKSDAGSRTGGLICKSGAEPESVTEITPSTDYTTYQKIIDLNPDGSVAWTNVTASAAEFGIKVVS